MEDKDNDKDRQLAIEVRMAMLEARIAQLEAAQPNFHTYIFPNEPVINTNCPSCGIDVSGYYVCMSTACPYIATIKCAATTACAATTDPVATDPTKIRVNSKL